MLELVGREGVGGGLMAEDRNALLKDKAALLMVENKETLLILKHQVSLP